MLNVESIRKLDRQPLSSCIRPSLEVFLNRLHILPPNSKWAKLHHIVQGGGDAANVACTDMDVPVGKYGPWVLQGPPNLERAPPTTARDVKLRLFCVPQVRRTLLYDLVGVGLTL
jgi:hypothetical protein